MFVTRLYNYYKMRFKSVWHLGKLYAEYCEKFGPTVARFKCDCILIAADDNGFHNIIKRLKIEIECNEVSDNTEDKAYCAFLRVEIALLEQNQKELEILGLV